MGDNATFTKRTLTSTLMVMLVAIVTFYFPNWVFMLLASALIGLALNEFYDMVSKKGIFVYKTFGIIVGMLVPFIIYLQMGCEGYFTFEPFLIFIACFFLFMLQFVRRDNSQALVSIAVTIFGLLYIAWFCSFIVKIKFLPEGTKLVAFLILVTKMGDIGAYLVGSSVGKHSLIPRISPKKTIEGTVGGLVFSLVAAMLSRSFLPMFSYWHLILLGGLMGVLSQVGDLAESLIKRDCGVKDSGSNLPGVGGILDLIDSLLFTTPIFYFYLKVIVK